MELRHDLGPACAAAISRTGVIARAIVGVALIVLALGWRDPQWRGEVLGLVVIPVLVIGAASLWPRRNPRPLSATGPVGHAVNLGVVVALFALPATTGAALLLCGASMLVAAATRSGGCEVTAISNAVLGRDDQVGCVLFAPIDAIAASANRTSRPTTERR
jgi:hypothetical protein